MKRKGSAGRSNRRKSAAVSKVKRKLKKPSRSGAAARARGSSGSRAGNLDSRILAAIVESSDAAIIGKTLDGIVTSWNPGAERTFGYSAAEMIGRPVDVIAAPGRPDEMKRILARIRR